MIDFLREHIVLTKILFGAFLLILFALAILIAHKYEKTETRSERIKKYSTVAIFSALSILLYYLRIPFPVFTFLKIQFSNLPAYIIGFLLGPASGMMVVFIRTAVTIPFTSTLCVGEVADLLIGSATVLTSSLIYLSNKTKKQAGLALVFGSCAWILTAIIANWLLLVPLYIGLYFNANEAAFVGMLSGSLSFINESNYMFIYTLLGVIPFNLIITSACSLITFLVYKRISKVYKNIAKDEASGLEEAK